MTTVSFSDKTFGELEIPAENLMGIFQPTHIETDLGAKDIVANALANPVGSPRLSEMAAPGQRVTILVDDYTRMTPAAIIVPQILDELFAAGVSKADIRMLISLGTHRPMTEAEMVKKLGADIVRKYKVANHTWSDRSKLVSYGRTSLGIDVEVNRIVQETDLLIGTGHIVPHRVAGYSGGAKIVQPGICGAVTTGQTHWLSALRSGKEILGVADNPVRDAIDSVAEQVGLKFIVNAIQDAEARVVGAVSGSPIPAHKAGCLASERVFAATMPDEADIVVIESYPSDFDLWQAAKAIYASELALKPGGTIVLLAHCPEGVAGQHGEVQRLGYLGVNRVKEMVDSGELTDLTAAAHIAHVGRPTQDIGRCIMVSQCLSPEEVRHINFDWAVSPDQALQMAFDRNGRNASVAVLKHGSELLPVVARD
jgi:lactate racemase